MCAPLLFFHALGISLDESSSGEENVRADRCVQVIITSYLFPDGKFNQERLDSVLRSLGNNKSKLVIDLSCRRTGEQSWHVAMNKWQKITDMEVNQGKSRPKLSLPALSRS